MVSTLSGNWCSLSLNENRKEENQSLSCNLYLFLFPRRQFRPKNDIFYLKVQIRLVTNCKKYNYLFDCCKNPWNRFYLPPILSPHAPITFQNFRVVFFIRGGGAQWKKFNIFMQRLKSMMIHFSFLFLIFFKFWNTFNPWPSK